MYGFVVVCVGDACALIRVEADIGAMRVVARYDDVCFVFMFVYVCLGKGKFGFDVIIIGVVCLNVVGEGVREYERFVILVADGATRRVGIFCCGDVCVCVGLFV